MEAGALEQGGGAVGVGLHDCGEVGQRFVVEALPGEDAGAAEAGRRAARLDADRLGVVGGGAVELVLAREGVAAREEGADVVGGEG